MKLLLQLCGCEGTGNSTGPGDQQDSGDEGQGGAGMTWVSAGEHNKENPNTPESLFPHCEKALGCPGDSGKHL